MFTTVHVQCHLLYSVLLYLLYLLYSVFCRSVTTQDEGYYECQISTELKMSRLVHLQITGDDMFLHDHS